MGNPLAVKGLTSSQVICTNFVVAVAFPVFSEMDRFANTAAILISIVSNSYYGMLWV